MSATIGGLGFQGRFVLLGVDFKPIQLNMLPMLTRQQHILGWPSGSSVDSEDTLRFSDMTGVKSVNEVYPLEKAQEAYDRMMSGKARFRVVLKVG